MRRGLILLGGGLDSTSLLIAIKWLRQTRECELHALHFQYGQAAAAQELKAVQFFTRRYDVPLRIVEMPIGELATSAIMSEPEGSAGGSNVLEGRNVIFTMMAAAYASRIEADDLYLGFHTEPENTVFLDARGSIIPRMQAVIDETYKRKVRLLAPFAAWTRTTIVRTAAMFDCHVLSHTHTCYRPVEGGCGECIHCIQKQEILNNICTGNDLPLSENS